MTQAISISPAPTFNFTYDDDGRLLESKNGTTVQTTYTYIATRAQLTSIVDAAGTTTFTYNAAGQVATVDDPLSATGLSTYDYDGSTGANTGRLLTRTDTQANLRWGLAYEPATGRLDTQTIVNNTTCAALASFDLGYDLAGNVTSKGSSVFANASNATWAYTYDAASRLTNATGKNAAGANTTWTYAYDAGGNRTQATEVTGGSTISNWTTTYDASGLATTANDAVGGETVTYTYDTGGITLTKADSTIAANDWAYTYDAYSRLTCAKSGATTCGTTASANRVTYTLDALNRATSRTLNTTATTYVYRGVSEDPASTTTSAQTTTYAYTAGGSPLGQKLSGTMNYYLRDPHGDTVGVVSTAAANAGTTAFDPWGKPLAVSGTQPLFGYQSDITDTLTKAVDMGTRWYAPGTGRFTTRDVVFGDPLHPVSLNQWVYGSLNPVSASDPTGMYTWCETCSDTKQRKVQEASAIQRSTGVSWGEAMSVSEPAPPPPRPLDYSAVYMAREIYGPVAYHVEDARDAAKEFNIDAKLLTSIMFKEGAGRQWADGAGLDLAELLQTALDPVPSVGIMQMQFDLFQEVSARHADSFGPIPAANDRLEYLRRLQNEETAIRYAAAHLSDIAAALPARDRTPQVLAGIYNGGFDNYGNFKRSGVWGGTVDEYVASVSSIYANDAEDIYG